MKQKTYLTLGAVLVSLAAVVGLSAVSFAATGNASGSPTAADKHGRGQFAPNSAQAQANRQAMQDKMAAVDKALEAGDYQAWVTAVGADSQQAKEVTAEEFPQLVQAYNLEKEARAKLDEAGKIRESIGLKLRPGMEGKFPFGFKAEAPQ